jgi:hypothetical protein
MMDVAAVSAEEGLTTEKAPRDGQSRIEQRNGERKKGSGHA